MLPWEKLERFTFTDGVEIELRRRGQEYLILAGGHRLMSSGDDDTSIALATLGCAHLDRAKPARVLVGGLGMGYTLRAALDATGARAVVEVAELIPRVVDWNRGVLGSLAGHPLDDARTRLHVGDVRERIQKPTAPWDAILLDVDNGPDSLAHDQNDALYGPRGIEEAWNALRPGGVLGVWSFSDDKSFTKRLQRQGFTVKVNRVKAMLNGNRRYHCVWIGRRARPRRKKEPNPH